jgi:hypothetical protein
LNSVKAGETAATPAAAAEAISGDAHVMKLENGRYYSIPWGNPSVGTPWVAEVTGLDPKYGLARRFLHAAIMERRESLYLIDVKDMKTGAFYEVKNPSSWRHPDMRYYFHILNIDLVKGEITIEYVARKDLIMYFRERDSPIGGDDAPIWSGGHSVP